MSVYEIIVDRILDKMEQGNIPWKQEFKSGKLPANYITKKPYRGINSLLLQSAGHTSPWYLTKKQIHSLGGRINQEDFKNAELVVFYKQPNRDSHCEYEDESDDKYKKKWFLIRFYKVWNITQTDLEYNDLPQSDILPITACENIIAGMPGKPQIEHIDVIPSYSPSKDIIRIPPQERFTRAEFYYSTLFHELVHSTGHQSRCSRETITDLSAFGSNDYGVEELIAEIGASFLCNASGIQQTTIDNNAAYIQNWCNAIRANKKLIFSASSKAQKAVDYILGEMQEAAA